MDAIPPAEGPIATFADCRPSGPRGATAPLTAGAHRRSLFGRLLMAFFLLVLRLDCLEFFAAGVGRQSPQPARANAASRKNSSPTTARRPKRWPSSPSKASSSETDDGFVKRQIDRVLTDDNVKAVVLRVDSPGGTVSGSDYIYHHLRKHAREARRFPWWSAWAASRPAADTMSPWPSATSRTRSSPSQPPSPARSACSFRTTTWPG